MPGWLKKARHNLEQGDQVQTEQWEDIEGDALFGIQDLFPSVNEDLGSS